MNNTPPLFAEPARWSVQQSERTASRVIEGKAVVITIDTNELHVLNGVGTRVWELLDGRSLAAVIDAVVAEYEVDTARASADVRTFLERLLALGAVQARPTPAP